MNAPTNVPVSPPLPEDLDDRSRDVFRRIVDAYLESGEATGSRTLSREMPVSPATIRNVMSDLEHLGLIYAPHVSAGRMPTELGLRMFVDGLMEVGDLGARERARIEAQIAANREGAASSAGAGGPEGVLTRASTLLSGLARGAGVVVSAKHDERLKHVEFVRLDARQALVVLVGASGAVENRLIDLPPGLSAGALTEASNWLNAHITGRTIAEARAVVAERLEGARGEIDAIAQGLVDQGLAVWSGDTGAAAPQLIVRGRANLLDGGPDADLDRLRQLFDELETKQGLAQLLDLTEAGEGVKIFIGSENKLFSLSGSSIVVAPYRDHERRIIGAVGVIGPTRLNYARIVPVVDYTAQLVGRLLYGGRAP